MLWEKRKEQWKKLKEKTRGRWKGGFSFPNSGTSLLPAAILLFIVVFAVAGYQPISGQEKKLADLFADYEGQMEARLLSSVDAGEAESGEKNSAGKKKSGQTELEDGVYTGTGTGFGGQIKVSVTIKDKKITGIEILSAPGEDSSFLAKAKGVIDRILEAQTADVDTVSGATYSSRGILAAVKNALYGTGDSGSTAQASGSGTSSPETVSAVEKPKGGYEDGTYTGSGTGFGGKIKVKVTIKNGKIKKIKIVSASGETSSYLKKAKKLLRTMIKKQTPNVEAVSGATYSSNGIIKAVQNALKKAAKKTDSAKKTEKSTETEKAKEDTVSTTSYKNGTYTGTGKGFRGNISVKVKIKNGKITSIVITDGGKEDKDFLAKAKTIIEDMLEKQTADVDVATGATYSSKGIIEAVTNALAKAKKKESGEKDASDENTESKDGENQNTEKEENTSTETDAQNGDNKDSASDSSDKTDSGEESQKDTASGTTAEENEGTENSETTSEETNSPYKDGTYTGKSMGFYGNITASVTIQEGRITSISLSAPSGYEGNDEEESEWLYKVKDQIISAAIRGQSVDGVSAVSGASFSSKGAIGAIQKALNQAKKE